jgi:hypothetical protein
MEWEMRVKRIWREKQIESETFNNGKHHSTTTLSSPTSLSFAHYHCASRSCFSILHGIYSTSLLNKMKCARFHGSNPVIILCENLSFLIIKAELLS